MVVKETKMTIAWKAAAADLNIEFIVPFELTDALGRVAYCCGLVPKFGHANGMMILSREHPTFEEQCGEDFDESEFGFGSSGLSPAYEDYDRAAFIDVLRNWGWNGDAQNRPIWYLDARICDADSPCEACVHRDELRPEICSAENLCPACRFYWSTEQSADLRRS